jgi:hypothetical protein
MPARGVRNNYQYHNGGHNRNPHGHSGAAGFNERKGGGGAVSTPSALDVAVPCPSGGFMHKVYTLFGTALRVLCIVPCTPTGTAVPRERTQQG